MIPGVPREQMTRIAQEAHGLDPGSMAQCRGGYFACRRVPHTNESVRSSGGDAGPLQIKVLGIDKPVMKPELLQFRRGIKRRGKAPAMHALLVRRTLQAHRLREPK